MQKNIRLSNGLNGSNFLKAKNIDSLGFSDDGKAVVINYGSTVQTGKMELNQVAKLTSKQ
mgnify:CR=1 FL=1